MAIQEELLDIKQAAGFLQVSETSLRRWTSQGRLPCLRVGRKRERRFRRADLLAFLEEQPGTVRGAPSAPESRTAESIGGIAMPFGTHLCAMYTSEEGRTRQAVAFLSDGLRPGVVSFLLGSRAVQQQVLDRLRKGHPGLDAEIAAGNLVTGEYAPTAAEQNDFWERSFVAALGRGAISLRVVGDSPWPGSGSPLASAVAYEREYERLFARRFPLITLCLYPADALTGRDVCELYSSHPDSFAYPVERIID